MLILAARRIIIASMYRQSRLFKIQLRQNSNLFVFKISFRTTRFSECRNSNK